MRFLGIDLDLLTPAERRDLANALLRAAWSAALEDTRVLLLDLLLEVDEAAVGRLVVSSRRRTPTAGNRGSTRDVDR